MKKIIMLFALGSFFAVHAQFKIYLDSSPEFSSKEAYVYTLDGSKDILNSKEIRKGNSWTFSISKPYSGMMKIIFPETNTVINFISENKDVKIKFITNSNTIKNVDFIDEANALMNNLQDMEQKKEFILPALYQIKEYYQEISDFGNAMDKEISRLSQPKPDATKFPFINYYTTNYSRFVIKDATQPAVTEKEIQDFLVKSNEYLETSSLLRPILVTYLNTAAAGSKTVVPASVDQLLSAVNTETPRGQTILSELIDIFDTYGMEDLKKQYLTEAKNLKCTINDRLASTIAINSNTEIGAKFPNNKFINASNTKAKSIYDVKADKKIVIFWSSTCSHCEKELPEILEKYSKLKSQNVEVIGLSLDSDKDSYSNKIKSLPWINDTELKGWYSSYAETYNVHATPTYYILDSDNKIIAKPDHAKDVITYFKL